MKLHRPAIAAAFTVTMSAAGLTLALSLEGPLVIAAEIALLGLLAIIGIHLSRLLHELVPSGQRSGVSSAIGTMSWLTFLPCSLLFGALSAGTGIRAAGWIITGLVTVAGLALSFIAARSCGRAAGPKLSSSAGGFATGVCA